MYFVDFFKNIFKKNNIGVLVWLIINTIIVSSFLSVIYMDIVGSGIFAIALGTASYIVILAVTLSPLGEWILRVQNGCKKIERIEDFERLNALFREVCEKAKAQNPEIPNDVSLYMCEDEDPNAFATGRRTICITSGLIKYNDDQIRAILAHEFGHLAHKDTDAILIVSVGNLIVSALFVIYRVIFKAIAIFMQIIFAFVSKDLGMVIGTGIIKFFIDLLLALAMRAWTKLGVLICLHSARKNEYMADEYSFNMGYGIYLCQFLDNHCSLTKKGLWAALNSSHPSGNSRIAHLQQLGCTYRRQ